MLFFLSLSTISLYSMDSLEYKRIFTPEELNELIKGTYDALQIWKDPISDFIYYKTHPWKDSSNTIFFQLSFLNQTKKFGDVVLKTCDSDIKSLIEKEKRDEFLILEMNKETQERNPESLAISTREAIWINSEKWNLMSKKQHLNLLAYHLSIPHTKKLLQNNIEWATASALVGSGLWGLNKMLKKSRHPLLPLGISFITCATVLHRIGLTKDIQKAGSFIQDMPQFSDKELQEIDAKTQHLLSTTSLTTNS